jgi:hypothetical protein
MESVSKVREPAQNCSERPPDPHGSARHQTPDQHRYTVNTETTDTSRSTNGQEAQRIVTSDPATAG